MRHLEISDRRSGKTARIIDEIVKSVKNGKHCTLFVSSLSSERIFGGWLYSKLKENGIILSTNEQKNLSIINYFHDGLVAWKFQRRINLIEIEKDKIVFMDDFDQSVFMYDDYLFEQNFNFIVNSHIALSFPSCKNNYLVLYDEFSHLKKRRKIERLIEAFGNDYESYAMDNDKVKKTKRNCTICSKCGKTIIDPSDYDGKLCGFDFSYTTEFGISQFRGYIEGENQYKIPKFNACINVIAKGENKGEYVLDKCPYKLEHELMNWNGK